MATHGLSTASNSSSFIYPSVGFPSQARPGIPRTAQSRRLKGPRQHSRLGSQLGNSRRHANPLTRQLAHPDAHRPWLHHGRIVNRRNMAVAEPRKQYGSQRFGPRIPPVGQTAQCAARALTLPLSSSMCKAIEANEGPGPCLSQRLGPALSRGGTRQGSAKQPIHGGGRRCGETQRCPHHHRLHTTSPAKGGQVKPPARTEEIRGRLGDHHGALSNKMRLYGKE